MSPTFNQTTHGEHARPVQNSGHMNLTVNNDNHPRGGDSTSIGNVEVIGSVGGSNVQNTIYAGSGTAEKNPNTTGI